MKCTIVKHFMHLQGAKMVGMSASQAEPVTCLLPMGMRVFSSYGWA